MGPLTRSGGKKICLFTHWSVTLFLNKWRFAFGANKTTTKIPPRIMHQLKVQMHLHSNTTTDNCPGNPKMETQIHVVTVVKPILNWAKFCFVNLVQGIWWTVMKLCLGFKKLCSTCSGNIRPVWQTLPLTGWEQREFSYGWGRKKSKNGWQCQYFTRFGGN